MARDNTKTRFSVYYVYTLILAVMLNWVSEGNTLAQTIDMVEVIPEETDEVLLNPGMGLYMQAGSAFGYQPEQEDWYMSICDIAYYRMDWSRIKPEEDGNLFDEYFGPIFDFWVNKMGKRVAFRVMCENVSSREKYVTPEWVFARGVPSVKHTNRYGEQIDPVFWDERYLEIQREFIYELGEYLDGKEGFEFIDIGSIGEWGEMHLGLHIPGRWTPEQLEETGYTEEKYIKAYRYIIDAFAEAFPHSQVFLNVGDYAAINDYAALRGIHFRQDGLTPGGPSSNVGKRFYHPYSQRGIKGNYEFHSSYKSMKSKGWDLRETIDKGLEDPISYMNTNIIGMSRLKDAPDEVKDLLTDAGRRLGFRFVITKLRVQKEIRLDGERPARLMIEHNWKNEGVAPCYESYALNFALVSQAGEIVAEKLHFPKVPTTLWRPGEEITERTLIRIPADARTGKYTLKLYMFAPEQPERRILLGIAGRDSEDSYELCHVDAVKAERRERYTVYEEGFESGGLWSASSGMEAAVDKTMAHGGEYSMLITGTQQDNWGYASHSLESPVLPGSRYRLSCWMLVESIDPALEPYLKIGLEDVEGEWLTNWNTNRYDLSKPGTWQYLEITFETTMETGGGHLSVEKGGREARITAAIRIDDVELELLESP